ncbi:MAG: DUF4363 family protein [Clostridia bacterium]|nr:DUF4363 family protein [Clostridia bacterium]
MIIVFLRAIILFAVLLFTMRLMGKRQIGEMEPFELVITLVISELACIPMADRSIPITFGIVAILTMFVIHQAILLLSKNKKMQTVINGKPVMVIDSHGIDVQALNSLNMTVGDILQSMRSAEYFSLEEITYGIMETNGQLTVIPNKNMTNRQQTLPIVVIEQGKWNDEEITQHNFDKASLQLLLRQERINVKNVVILAIDEKQPHDLANQAQANFLQKRGGKTTMTKNIWAGLIALVLVLTCGILEVVCLSKQYDQLANECTQMMSLCQEEKLTVQDYNAFRDKWMELRELSELMLPHIDVYELNLRFAEAQSYAENEDYTQLYAQFCVIEELLHYVPHLMKPIFRHII